MPRAPPVLSAHRVEAAIWVYKATLNDMFTPVNSGLELSRVTLRARIVNAAPAQSSMMTFGGNTCFLELAVGCNHK